LAINRIQQLSASASNQGYQFSSDKWVTTLPKNPTIGNILLMYVASKTLFQAESIVQGGSNATWSLLTSYTNSPNKYIYVYALPRVPRASNSTITINLTTGQYNFVTFIEEIEGFTYPYTLDVVSSNAGTSTNVYYSGITTTNFNNEYLVNLYCYYSNSWQGDSLPTNITSGYSTSGITTSTITQRLGGWVGNSVGQSPQTNDFFGLIITTGISTVTGTIIGGNITDANSRNNDYSAISIGFVVNQFTNNPIPLPTNPLTDGRGLASVFTSLTDVNAARYWFNSGIRNIFMPDKQPGWGQYEVIKGTSINVSQYSSLNSAIDILLNNGVGTIRPITTNYSMNVLYFDYDSTAVYPQFTFANFSTSNYSGSAGFTTFVYYAAQNNVTSSVSTIGASDSNWQLVTPFWNNSTNYGIGSFIVYQTGFGTSFYCMSISASNIGNTPTTITNSFWNYCGAYQPVNNGNPTTNNAYSISVLNTNGYSPYNLWFPQTTWYSNPVGLATSFLPYSTEVTSYFPRSSSSNTVYNLGYTQIPVTNYMQQGWANYMANIIGIWSGKGIIWRFWNEPNGSYTTPYPYPLQGLGHSYAIASKAKFLLQAHQAIKNKLNQNPALANEYIMGLDGSGNGMYFGAYTLNTNTGTALGNIGTSIVTADALFDYHNYPVSSDGGGDPEVSAYYLGYQGSSRAAGLDLPIKGANSEWAYDATWSDNYVFNYPASNYTEVPGFDSGGNLNLLGFTTTIGGSNWGTNWKGVWNTQKPISCVDPNGGPSGWQFSDPDYIGNTANNAYNIGEIGVIYAAQTNRLIKGSSYCASVWIRTNPSSGQSPYLPIKMGFGNYELKSFVVDNVWRRYSLAYTFNGSSSLDRLFYLERFITVGLTTYSWQIAFPQIELINSPLFNSSYNSNIGVTTLILDYQKQISARQWIAGKNNNDALMIPYVYYDKPASGERWGLSEYAAGVALTSFQKRPAFLYSVLPSYNANIIRDIRQHGSTGGSYNSNPGLIGYTGNQYITYLSTSPTVGNSLVCYIASKTSLNINNITLVGSKQSFGLLFNINSPNGYLYVYSIPYISTGISTTVSMSLVGPNNLFVSFIEELSGVSSLNSYVYNTGLNTSIYSTGSLPLSNVSTGYLLNIFIYSNPSLGKDPYIWNPSNNYLNPQVLNFSPNPISQGANGWIGVSTNNISISDTFGMSFTYRPYISDPDSGLTSLGGQVTDFYNNSNNYLAVAIAFNQGSNTPVIFQPDSGPGYTNRPLPSSALLDGKGAGGFTTAGGGNNTVSNITSYYNDGFQIFKIQDVLHGSGNSLTDANWWETEKIKGSLTGISDNGINTGLIWLDDAINSITSISTSSRVMYTFHNQNNPIYFDYDYSCNYPLYAFCTFPATGFGTGITNFVYFSLINNNIGTSPGINSSNNYWRLVTPYWTSVTNYVGLASFVVYQSPLGTSQYYLAQTTITQGVAPTGGTDSNWYFCNVPSGYAQNTNTPINYTPFALTIAWQGLNTTFTPLAGSSPYQTTAPVSGYNASGASISTQIGWQQNFFTSIQQKGFANFATKLMQRYAGKGVMWEIGYMPNSDYGPKSTLNGLTYLQNMNAAVAQNASYYYQNFVNLVNTKRGIASIANEYIVGPGLLMAPNTNNYLGLGVTYAYYLLTNYFGPGLSYYADAISSYNWFDGFAYNPENASKFQNQVLKKYMSLSGKQIPLISSEWGVGKSSFSSANSGYLARFNNQISWPDTLNYPTTNANYGLFTTSPSIYQDNPTGIAQSINLLGFTSLFGSNYTASSISNGQRWYNLFGGITTNLARLTGIGSQGDPNFSNFAYQFDLLNDYNKPISFGDQNAYKSGIGWGTAANTIVKTGLSSAYIASVYLRGVFQPDQIQYIPISVGIAANNNSSQVFFVDSTWRRYSLFVQLPNSNSLTNRTFSISKVFETAIGFSSTLQMAFPQLEAYSWPIGYASALKSMMFSWGQQNVITRKLLQDSQDGVIASIYASIHESKYSGSQPIGGGIVTSSNAFVTAPYSANQIYPAYNAFNNGLSSGAPAYNSSIFRQIRHFGSTGGSSWASPSNIGYSSSNNQYSAYLNQAPTIGNSLLIYLVSKNPLQINSIVQGGNNQAWQSLQNGTVGTNNLYISVWGLMNVYAGATNLTTINFNVAANLFCSQIDEIANISPVSPIGVSTYGFGLSTSIYVIPPVNSTTANNLWINIYAYYNSNPGQDPHLAYATNGYLTQDILFNPPNPVPQGLAGWYGINTSTVSISDTFGMNISYRPVNALGQIGGSLTDIIGNSNNYLGLALAINILGTFPYSSIVYPRNRKYYNGIYNK